MKELLEGGLVLSASTYRRLAHVYRVLMGACCHLMSSAS